MKIGAPVSYAPRSAVRDWLNQGWRFIPGVEYRQGEYAVLMARVHYLRQYRAARRARELMEAAA